MKESYPLIFRIFRFFQKMLRGSGLGKFRILRSIRDRIYNLLRPRSEMIIEVQGFKMLVDPSLTGGVTPQLLLDGVFEPFETQIIKNILKPGFVFVDIGANIGYYSLLASTIVKDEGKVIAFEPEPINFRTLRENVRLNNFCNIICEQLAISDKDETKYLFIDSQNAGGHHLYDSKDGAKAIAVKATSLDAYCDNKFKKLDLIKMDIQGYEPIALRGMRKQLELNYDIKIFTEFDPNLIQSAGESPRDFLSEIYSHGFNIMIVDEHEKKLKESQIDQILDYCIKNDFVNLLCSRNKIT